MYSFFNSRTNNVSLNAVDENDSSERKILMMWDRQERIFRVMFLRRQAEKKFRAQVRGLVLSTVLSENTVQLTLEQCGG